VFASLVFIVVALFLACFVITLLMHLWLGAPYVPTPMRIVERMVELAELKPGQVVYDLGAGDGRLLIAAKRKEPKISAIGYELVPTVWILGMLRIICSGCRVSLRMRDARCVDLRDADCVFLYLLPGVLAQMLPVFQAQLRPGTRVISSVFALSGKTPKQTEIVQWMGAERKVWVYQW